MSKVFEHRREFSLTADMAIERCYGSSDGTVENMCDFTQAYESFISSLNNFGTCELYAREAGRLGNLNIDPLRKQFCEEQIVKYNQMGLSDINKAINYLSGFINAYNPSTEFVQSDEFDNSKISLMDVVSNMEMKPSDATKILNQYNAAFNACQSEGEAGILNFMLAKFTELRDVRNTDSRGTEENIPIWKVIAIAALIGYTIFVVIRCLVRGRNCGQVVNRAERAGYTIAILVAIFC